MFAFCLIAPAQERPIDSLPPLLPEQEEIELAKSAGLPTFTEDATIWVLRRGGYVLAREGSNGFTCLVGRDYPGTSWPCCWDPEGTKTIVPRILRQAELLEQGKTMEEIRREEAERFLKGVYRAPGKPGLAYMLSKQNIVFDGEKVRWFPPHLMFYAPNMTAEEIGANFGQYKPRSPGVLYQGDPHAYFIVVVPEEMPAQPEPD